MEKITDFTQCAADNKIIADSTKSFLENGSCITFNGKGNILFVEDGVKLFNSQIKFNADNALVYLSKSRFDYYVDISANYGSSVFIGQNNYINGRLSLITSERKNIIIGGDGLISFGIFVRTADPHLIYSCETKKRLNPSKSVLIGDHVWLGQGAMVLKGTVIGSGSILGGGSVITNKTIPSNASAAGNSAKVISENIFFSNECVHNFRKEQTEHYQIMNSDKWIYSEDTSQIDFKKLDERLYSKDDADSKLEIVLNGIVKNASKNRFYISGEKKKGRFFSSKTEKFYCKK